MKKSLTILAALLFMATLPIAAIDYSPNFTGTKNGDRPLNSVKIEGTSYSASEYKLTNDELVQLYVDATEKATLKVGAGDEVAPSVAYGGAWMHAYVYIDTDENGFTAGVADDGYTPTGDLVSYSAYNALPDAGGLWRNSIGEQNGNNTVVLPSFKAPEKTGKYRIRFKIDWNSIDPAGCDDDKNRFDNNRGSIIDLTLEVADKTAGYVEELFKSTTVENNEFAQGTAWYTLQIGANGYVIDNHGDEQYIALDEVKSSATDDAQLWAFTGDNTNGYRLYNKQAGASKVLAAPTKMTGSTGSTSYPILVDADAIPTGYCDLWMFQRSSDLGDGDTYFYMYEKGYRNNKVNNRDNKFAFWNGGADSGSTLNICFAQAEYPITTLTGVWTASNNAGTWASAWQSNADPKINLKESQGRNNMASYTNEGDIQLFTCLQSAAVNGVHSATYSISAGEGYLIAGYRFDFVSSGSTDVTVTPAGAQGVTANSTTAQSINVSGADEAALTFDVTATSNMFANTSNFYATIIRSALPVEESQEIFTTKKGGIPYRIPAIALAKNGDLIAVADYRHSGSDIGVVNNGRIDLHARISKDNGTTWNDKFSIVEGKGASSPDFMHVGFGDPCIVADRESDRVLVLSCAGNVSFQNGTRNRHQNIARFYSEDNGATWSEPVDIAESIYSQFDNSPLGPVMAMFIGSGKIHQSRYVKVNDYYRLYCAVLAKDRNANYINFVLYSDNFGDTWSVLGTTSRGHCTSADEPKVDELPNGNVILSSRTTGGRHYNIFTFTDAEKAEGSWGTQATSNSNVNGVSAIGNSTNGEILILPVVRNEDGAEMWIALQSVPFGSGRNNVGIYYKELASEEDYNTPANFAKNWDGRHQASYLPSAYSTMCLQADNTIGFLYEESTHGADYTIQYKNYSLETITDSAYTIIERTPEVGPEDGEPSEETIALIATAKEILEITGIGYPAESPRATLKAAIEAAEANPTKSEGSKLEAALQAYIATEDVVLPSDGKTYTITMVTKNGNNFYLNYTGSDIKVTSRNEDELPATAHFNCEENGDGTVTLSTTDGKYLVYHSKYAGVSWLQGGGDTDGLQETKDDMTNIKFAKMANGGNVSAESNEQVFGLLTWYSKRGYDVNKNKDTYGYVVIKADGSDYDGADAPFWNQNFSSAFLVEEVENNSGIENVTSDNENNAIYDLQGRRVVSPVKGIYIINGNKVLVK